MIRTDATSRPPWVPDESHQNVRRLVEHNRRCCQAVIEAAGRQTVQSVAIVGAGLMGRAIAAASLAGGLHVVLHDTDPDARARAADGVLAELVASGQASSQEADNYVRDRLRVTERLDDAARCELVLESVTETADAKRRVYAELEPLLPEGAILASNTSTIPVDRLATGLRRPERFCAVHFFHPVARRPLVEIVRGPKTSPATLATAIGYAQALDKMALVVDDGPGFVVNRLLLPYLTEAVELLADGVPIERVEAVATAFGMAKGPLALLDEIGLDTVIAGGRVLWEAFPSRILISPLLIAMYKAGRFGVKSGAGFFNYGADGVERLANRLEGHAPSCPSCGVEGHAPSCPLHPAARGHDGAWPSIMAESARGHDGAWPSSVPGSESGVPGPKRSGGPEATPHASPPIDPVALEKVADWSRPPRALTDNDVLDRLLLPMVLEATRLLEERKVDDPRDVDLGVLFGLGFPAARGGLLYWADTLGPAEIVARLARLDSLGPRVEPTGLLRHMFQASQRFYDLRPASVPVSDLQTGPAESMSSETWGFLSSGDSVPPT